MQFYENERFYDDSDPELDVIASKPKRAQWRHRKVGPSYVKFGRRVKYHGADLNAWINLNRIPTEYSESHQFG